MSEEIKKLFAPYTDSQLDIIGAFLISMNRAGICAYDIVDYRENDIRSKIIVNTNYQQPTPSNICPSCGKGILRKVTRENVIYVACGKCRWSNLI